eukprot:TRINITY_DN7438_c0_g1_i1.p1 TRINITY_DN7438_c0_g1~~TRINITY_DN7438_c0_g1_i1.p1  ORF type:complete len:267 (+),score=70.86 TRINITY_DN7438_c0_g1_i1:58-858(+)
MVILAAAVTTKSGKTLVSRQFVEMSRLRIESLLTAFPKLVNTDSQHTFVETDDIRYVYQPVDQLYVILVTNKASNITDDLQTMQLFTKLIPETCQATTEDAVLRNVFVLVHAMDEVVTLGYRENVTLSQIKTNIVMDSHEEKLQKIILESKMNEARDKMRKKAEEIDHQKAERIRAMSFQQQQDSMSYSSSSVTQSSFRETKTSSSSSFSSSSASSTSSSSSSSSESSTTVVPKTSSKGMQLGKARKTDDLVNQLNKDERKFTRTS